MRQPPRREGKRRLMVFLRAPIRGQVKTRLAAAVGEGRALHLYRWMVGRLLDELEPLRADLIVYLDQVWSPPPESAEQLWLRNREIRVQQGADLGRRMAGAFREVFAGGASQALLVGSDIPGIDSPLVERYFRRLGSHSMVLGPSRDGGYYLIGFRRESFRPEIFEDMPWSTDAVSRLTLQAAGRLGLSCYTGPVLRDVDTLADLDAVEPPPR